MRFSLLQWSHSFKAELLLDGKVTEKSRNLVQDSAKDEEKPEHCQRKLLKQKSFPFSVLSSSTSLMYFIFIGFASKLDFPMATHSWDGQLPHFQSNVFYNASWSLTMRATLFCLPQACYHPGPGVLEFTAPVLPIPQFPMD